MDGGADADMMDSDVSIASTPPTPPPASAQQRNPSLPPVTAELPSATEQIEAVRGLLIVARQLIGQGKPSEALQAVVSAMRAKGGEAAAFHVLSRAKELYRNKIHETTAADELASLFAECAIAEALPSMPEASSSFNVASQQSVEPDASGTSILAETGRKQIMLDAFSDGSSFVCLKCGGLVSNNRRDEHFAFWCGQS